MTEFLDRLEAHDMAADIFLPVEFDGRLHVGDLRVASAVSLSETLEEMKEELSIEDDEYEEMTPTKKMKRKTPRRARSSKPNSATSGNSCSTPVARRWTSMWPFT